MRWPISVGANNRRMGAATLRPIADSPSVQPQAEPHSTLPSVYRQVLSAIFLLPLPAGYKQMQSPLLGEGWGEGSMQ